MISRIGNINLYDPQIVDISTTVDELAISCQRVILKSSGTPIIKSFKFLNGASDNEKVSFVIYNGGSVPVLLNNLDPIASSGNGIQCFNDSDVYLYPFEHADVIYNNADGVFDIFINPNTITNEVQLPIDGTIYFGDKNTDGSWRISVSSGDFIREKRISGVWTLAASDAI